MVVRSHWSAPACTSLPPSTKPRHQPWSNLASPIVKGSLSLFKYGRVTARCTAGCSHGATYGHTQVSYGGGGNPRAGTNPTVQRVALCLFRHCTDAFQKDFQHHYTFEGCWFARRILALMRLPILSSTNAYTPLLSCRSNSRGRRALSRPTVHSARVVF